MNVGDAQSWFLKNKNIPVTPEDKFAKKKSKSHKYVEEDVSCQVECRLYYMTGCPLNLPIKFLQEEGSIKDCLGIPSKRTRW